MPTPQLAIELDLGFLDPALFACDPALDAAFPPKPLPPTGAEPSAVPIPIPIPMVDSPGVLDGCDLLDAEFWTGVIAMEQGHSMELAMPCTPRKRGDGRVPRAPGRHTAASAGGRGQRKVRKPQRVRRRTCEQRVRERKQKKQKEERFLQLREELLLAVRHLRRVLLLQIVKRYARGLPVAGQGHGHGALEPSLLAFMWNTTTQLLHHMQAFTSQNRDKLRERIVETMANASLSAFAGVGP
ncbi:hypothetical protein P43SY_005673 [Pythium insidiosum]|uniref:Uncharacterized protein n=1 Tax=Pythium insidiosum TaxID=114742 RepID=A0AAD5LEJ1_PYTIN|nr:hypothetical protein P43SY_005673 [Pythium insidiosum]